MSSRKHAFLLHVWLERDESVEPQDAEWRASIEHVASGERLYFREMPELHRFLARWTGRRDSR